MRTVGKKRLLFASFALCVAGAVFIVLAFSARATPCFKTLSGDQSGGLRGATVQDWAKCQQIIDSMRQALGGVTFPMGVTLYYGGGNEPAVTANLQANLDSIKRRTIFFGLTGILCLGAGAAGIVLALRRQGAIPVASQG
jgi:hypothetical protein